MALSSQTPVSIEATERRSIPLEVLDELVASEEVREGLAEDTGRRIELAAVAREVGIDPTELGL